MEELVGLGAAWAGYAWADPVAALAAYPELACTQEPEPYVPLGDVTRVRRRAQDHDRAGGGIGGVAQSVRARVDRPVGLHPGGEMLRAAAPQLPLGDPVQLVVERHEELLRRGRAPRLGLAHQLQDRRLHARRPRPRPVSGGRRVRPVGFQQFHQPLAS